MDKPANACNYFINPNKTKKLIFPICPHDEPYYIHFNRRGYIQISVLMWASSESEVRKRLLQVIDFRRECTEEYLRSLDRNEDRNRYDNEVRYKESLEAQLVELELVLEGVELDGCKFTITRFNCDHIVEVQWADNSGILRG